MKVNSKSGAAPIRPRVYAVYGLTEWEALIPAGRSKIRVRFTGGQISGHGVIPATYRTSDPAMFRIIEESPQYRSGRIRKR